MIGAIAPAGKDDDYFKELGQDNSIFFGVGSDLSSYTATSEGTLYLGFNDYALLGNPWATYDNAGSVTATVTVTSDQDGEESDTVKHSYVIDGDYIVTLQSLPSQEEGAKTYRVEVLVGENAQDSIWGHLSHMSLCIGGNEDVEIFDNQSRMLYQGPTDTTWHRIIVTGTDGSDFPTDTMVYEIYKILIPQVGAVESILTGIENFFDWLDTTKSVDVTPSHISNLNHRLYVPLEDAAEELVAEDFLNNDIVGIRLEIPVRSSANPQFFVKFAGSQQSWGIPVARKEYGLEIMANRDVYYGTRQYRRSSAEFDNPTASVEYTTGTSDVGDETNTASEVATSGTQIAGYIETEGDRDFYTFMCSSQITISLSNIPSGCDYDLYLYNASHQEVASSANSGSADESVSYTGSSGAYYVEVRGSSGHSAAASYLLKLEWTMESETPTDGEPLSGGGGGGGGGCFIAVISGHQVNR